MVQVTLGNLKSKLQIFRLENRYVGNLASYRGPVGVEIAVQGRGFTKYDSITMGEKETSTVIYLKTNSVLPFQLFLWEWTTYSN